MKIELLKMQQVMEDNERLHQEIQRMTKYIQEQENGME
jgi:hypothetical protein